MGKMLKEGSVFCWGSRDCEARFLFAGIYLLSMVDRLVPSSCTASFRVMSLKIISAMIGYLFFMAKLIAAW